MEPEYPEVPHDPAPLLAVSIVDAARVIGVSRTTIYELMADGDLPFAKIGRRTVIPFDELRRLLGERLASA